MGDQTTIPDFEKYIAKFQVTHGAAYNDFHYPDEASPEFGIPGSGEIPNLLIPEHTIFIPGSYVLAAHAPYGSSLTIRFKSHEGGHEFGGIGYGWKIVSQTADEIILQSERENELMARLIFLRNSGSATIDYYKDENDTPFLTKELTW